MRLALLSLFIPSLAAAGDFHRLYAEQATATSFLQNDWNKYQENYHPNYALDDDPKTAWVEGADKDGLGESLTIPVSDLKTARAVRLVLFNGYQKSKALLTANAAPRQLTVTVHGPGGRPSARQQLKLERKMGPQSFDIPVKDGVADVVLTLDSVHPGSKYRDTCISDVQVFVDSDVPYKAEVEQAKRDKLSSWKKERLEAVKYYASLPPAYPYASPHFDQTGGTWNALEELSLERSGPEPAQKAAYVLLVDRLQTGTIEAYWEKEDQALLKELLELRSDSDDKGRWYEPSPRGKTVPPENFRQPDFVEILFHLGDVQLAAKKGPGERDALLMDVEGRSNLLLLEGSVKNVKKVFFTYRTITTERSSTTDTTFVIARLEGGKLTRLVTLSEYEGISTHPEVVVDVTLPTYREGKVSSVKSTRFRESGQRGVKTGDSDEPDISVEQTTLEARTSS